MLRSELVQLLSARQPHLLPRDVELAVNCIIEQMASTLAAGGDIEIRGFGHFTVRQRLARHARNPKTGEGVELGEKLSIRFKPGKAMRERVNAARDQYRIQEL